MTREQALQIIQQLQDGAVSKGLFANAQAVLQVSQAIQVLTQLREMPVMGAGPLTPEQIQEQQNLKHVFNEKKTPV